MRAILSLTVKIILTFMVSVEGMRRWLLTGNNRCAVKDLKEKEVHETSCLVYFIPWLCEARGMDSYTVHTSQYACYRQYGEWKLDSCVSIALGRNVRRRRSRETHCRYRHGPILSTPCLAKSHVDSQTVTRKGQYHQGSNGAHHVGSIVFVNRHSQFRFRVIWASLSCCRRLRTSSGRDQLVGKKKKRVVV